MADEPTTVDDRQPCPEGFHWIGQSWEHCDECGLPASAHAGMARLDKDTPFGLGARWVLQPWSELVSAGDAASPQPTPDVPGFEGSIGPLGRNEHRRPHVYARDVHSGAGNCVCGQPLGERRHTEAAPGVPIPQDRRFQQP